MMTGTISREFLPKGFCFVEGDDGKTYFLHSSEFSGGWSAESVRKGARIEFTPVETPKGLRAMEAKPC